MGDPRFLTRGKITSNDICHYLISECEGYDSREFFPGEPIYKESDNKKKKFYDYNDSDYFDDSDGYDNEDDYNDQDDFDNFKQPETDEDDEEYMNELEEAQQREWDEQDEYMDKLNSIHDRYPDFDADAAAFRHEDPEEAERNARIDDYFNNWY